MTNPSKLDLLRLARELTGSSDIDSLITSSNKLSQYLGLPGIAPVPLHEKPSFEKFLSLVKIQHPTRGAIPFRIYDFQASLARDFESHRFLVVNHSRQMGISYLTAAYALWFATYHPNKTILSQAFSYGQSLEMMDRVKYMYESQSDLKQGVVEYNKGNITFANGSRIMARSATKDSGRGIAVDLLILDQAAFLPHSRAAEYWTAMQPVLNTGGRMIMTSAPKEDTGLFHQIFTGAPQNGFHALEIPWHLHPDRDQAWADAYRLQIGDNMFEQEFNCKFTPAK